MLTPIQEPIRHFNAYYQDNALLLQFVVAEFVNTHQLICQIKHLSNECLLSIQHFESAVDSFFHHFNRLLGQLSHERLAISRWTKGPLTKLKDYCEQFSYNQSDLDPSHLTLHMHVHQAWLTAVYNLELVHSMKVCKNKQRNVTLLSHIRRTLNSLQNRLNSMTKQMPRVIHLYLDNENVVFFLMRLKEQLVTIYGDEWLEKLFKPLFKQRSISQFLTERYKERGFDHLLPRINSNFFN